MPFIRLPGGIRVAVEFSSHGKVVVNIYHVVSPNPITTLVLEEIAQIFIDWWIATQKSAISQDISLLGVSAQDIDVENGEKIYTGVTPPHAGVLTGQAVSNNVAMCVSLKTAKTGRSFQGRSYIAGLQESDVNGNEFSSTRTTQVAASFVTLYGTIIAAGYEPVIASFQNGGVPRVEAVGTPWQSIVVNGRVDTQRRRLPKSL